MKKLLMLAAATAAILPMTAQAQTVNSATGTINLEADANPTCAIRGIIKGSRGQGTYTNSTNTNVDNTQTVVASLDFNNLLMNQTNASTNGVIEQDLYLKAFCNYAGHTVSLKSQNGGMTNPASTVIADGSIFNKRIPYKARVRDWSLTGPSAELTATGTVTDSVQTTVSAGTVVQRAVNTDNASIRIETVADASNPLLAGTYSDVLTVKLGAAF
jgi:hypothetical protein